MLYFYLLTYFVTEKVLNGQTVGEGIKKTPAYETPLTKHDLDKWRREFWGKKLPISKLGCYYRN